jgi:two-component system CheB/CheR fusion protein
MKVVAIGASAGGIEAMRAFFENMPPDTGMSFVVVLHLAAERKSLLAEIIGRWTAMPVAEAGDDEPVAPDHVHVVPPGTVASLRDGCIRLRHLAADTARETAPIDHFFDSLAAELGPNAIGIVLSGTGHDGALGLKAIKATGGLTLAQGTDGSAPQHSGMPNSAIATGAVDLIASVEDMPKLIQEAVVKLDKTPVASQTSTDETALRLAICDVLRSRVGHDFAQYKEKTFMRRVERRMQVLGMTRPVDYLRHLESDQEESVLLFRDLLIGVTTFFRDAEAFAAVGRVVMPILFEGKGANDVVRVWVPGCATGEEAYSLAILLREYMDPLHVVPRVQIFATDIDEAAIGTARSGRYPATLLSGLSPERRDRFFIRTENGFVAAKEIRDLCTFSTHSLVRDPPFSRMNLVSCRNLLIYMDVDLQASVIPAFHYSLVPGGVLLLGSSETVTRHEELFTTLGKQHRIFQRRNGPSPPLKLPSRQSDGSSTRQPAFPRTGGILPESRTDWQRALATASNRVLERFAAPYVVITEDGTVFHYSSHVGAILQPALGPPSRSVFDMVRHNMRHGLRAALRTAAETGRPVEQSVPADADGQGPVNLVVEPLPGSEPDLPFLVVFKDGEGAPRGAPANDADGKYSVATELERENRDLREQLQVLAEEHESALEELRSANEELHSVNEEVQSSNEELETSKEEIQSVNEELQTVNVELSRKIDELDRTNSDLRNLFESTRVATVFLDQNMILRAYTPEVGDIYNLIPSDRGRPLTDIVSQLDYGELRSDVTKVMRTCEPLERRVSRRDGSAHYLLRILPYRAPDSSMDGSLITFTEVTGIVRAEEHQRLLVDELNHRVKNMLTVVISLATQTMRRAATMEEFSTVFMGRVHALTAAYALLSRDSWSSVPLAEIVTEELRPYAAKDGGNIVIDGPSVLLEPRGALAFGMAIHELASNAVKYGALSVPAGKVFVEWTLERTGDIDHLVLHWTERDGPPITTPVVKGFGSTLIERALTHDLSAEASIEFGPEGVRASIRAPIGRR